MYSIIVCGHGVLGEAMKDSVEMIFGKTNEFYSLSFYPGENTYDLLNKMELLIQNNHMEDVLILVDLFAGSPYNAAAILGMKNQNVEIVAGMNLALCLEALANRESKSLSEIVEYLKGIGPETIKSFRDITQVDEEDDLE